jgi:hypothetical protein
MRRAFSPMDLVVPTPGALPQAGMERALGPQPALVSIALGPSFHCRSYVDIHLPKMPYLAGKIYIRYQEGAPAHRP